MTNKKKQKAGYKKPPENTQFQKGKSGNPKGRPKGARNLQTDMYEELHETVPVRIGDKTTRVSKQRLILKKSMDNAIKGSERAASNILALAMKTGADNSKIDESGELSENYAAILARRDARLRAQWEAEMRQRFKNLTNEEKDNDE